MFTNLDLSKLSELLLYQQGAPLLFSSGLFLFLFLGFLTLYIALRKQTNWRILYVIAFSLYFYYKSSGLWFVLLIFTATSDFWIGHYIAKTTKESYKKWLVTLSLCINLGMLGYFKYTNFLIGSVQSIVHEMGVFFSISSWTMIEPSAPLDIFLPVGISFFTFQSLSYIIDVYRKRITPLKHWKDYLFYVSFFPQLVAGPIVRAIDFIPQIHKNPKVTRELFGEGLFLILCGLFKKAIISDYISLNFVDRVFDNPMLYTGFENLMGVYGYTLQIYCDFAGYSDMAIGIALLLGFRFNINFDAPYKSASITEFWRRWHISLSTWLKDYLYISLGGNRRGKIRQYINLIITMLLGGLWHGASFRFILWGLWHGLNLAIHKILMTLFPRFKAMGKDMTRVHRFVCIVITFHIVCLGWIFFRASSMENGFQVLSQIFHHFHPEIMSQFVEGYPMVCILFFLGYVLHFLPSRVDSWFKMRLTNAPLLIQAFVFILLMVLVIQMKSATVQPFIYFQF